MLVDLKQDTGPNGPWGTFQPSDFINTCLLPLKTSNLEQEVAEKVWFF